ncbi:lipocalin family protein [Chitinophaga sp. 22321]|uniref:Lipocalin family protein n=1 Tax=Chitinophaga hostae TaxID=2831022 RepID=A0ABS5J6W3_9BACT|nr:lipocalin family protein [Chitinophaga hostae]MBS0030968.1 lipocalin family protein [Chitinophaga hostae]
MNNKKLLALAVTASVSAAAAIVLYNSCKVSIPRGAKAISPFDVRRYVGTWYEIARLDYKFERNLTNVTATYSLNEDGDLEVDNKGFSPEKQLWKESTGKAKFVESPDLARLKVSFFGPFYAGYNIIDIDKHYKHALVAGNNLKYIWILSRTTSIPATIKKRFLDKAGELGYNTDALIWTKHDLNA